METLEIGGIKYTKASSVARDLGYTSDYVGQLCRSGKIDAQLLGRAWYVNADSIKSHKSDRYRSTKATSQKQLKAHIKENTDVKTETVPVRHVKVNDRHLYSNLKPQSSVYTEDQTELIPVLAKRENSVVSDRLNEIDSDPITVRIKPGVKSNAKKLLKKPGVITIQRKPKRKIVNRHLVSVTRSPKVSDSTNRRPLLILSLVLAVALVIFGLSVESRISTGEEQYVSSYSFNMNPIIEAVKSSNFNIFSATRGTD